MVGYGGDGGGWGGEGDDASFDLGT